MSDAGGTEYKELLKALRLLYKHNHIETPQYQSLVSDVVRTALEDDTMSVKEAMSILKDAGLIR